MQTVIEQSNILGRPQDSLGVERSAWRESIEHQLVKVTENIEATGLFQTTLNAHKDVFIEQDRMQDNPRFSHRASSMLAELLGLRIHVVLDSHIQRPAFKSNHGRFKSSSGSTIR